MSKRDPYDPRALGIAAGSTTDPFNLGLSDKGAQEFAKGTKSIETTSKMGGWMTIINMATSILDLSENPMVKVIMAFFEVISNSINAEFAESAAKLAETLFSEETAANIDSMAKGAGELNKVIIPLMDWIFSFNNTLPDLIKLGGEWSASIEKLYNDLILFFGGIGDGINDLTSGLQPLLGMIESIKDAIPGGDDDFDLLDPDTWF